MSHTWTTGEDALIRRWWGRVDKQRMADELGVSVGALMEHVRRMDPPLPRMRMYERGGLAWTPWEDAALRLMDGYGVPLAEIAEALQRGRQSVARRLRRIHGKAD